MRETSANRWIKIIKNVMFLSTEFLELTSDFLDHASSQNPSPLLLRIIQLVLYTVL